MRVPHGEIDEIIRHVVGHVFKQALKKVPVDPELHHSRRDRRDDGLAGGPYLPGDRHAVGVEAGGHPGGCHRAVEVVAHVLLARPNELHRLADLLRDQHRLPHEVLKDPAPAEAAAEHHLVNHDFARGYASGIGCDCERRLAILGGRPDLDQVGGHVRRAVLRLHGGVSEEGHLVVCFDSLDRLAERSIDIAVAAADARVGGAQARMQLRANRGA